MFSLVLTFTFFSSVYIFKQRGRVENKAIETFISGCFEVQMFSFQWLSGIIFFLKP